MVTLQHIRHVGFRHWNAHSSLIRCRPNLTDLSRPTVPFRTLKDRLPAERRLMEATAINSCKSRTLIDHVTNLAVDSRNPPCHAFLNCGWAAKGRLHTEIARSRALTHGRLIPREEDLQTPWVARGRFLRGCLILSSAPELRRPRSDRRCYMPTSWSWRRILVKRCVRRQRCRTICN
jgi:hypothetical protein